MDQQSFDHIFSELIGAGNLQPNAGENVSYTNNNLDLNTLIEQSLTPLSVNNIINTMNHNNMLQQQLYEIQPQPTMTPFDAVAMYHLLSGNLNGGTPVIIVNLPQTQTIISPPTPSAEMSQMNLQDHVAGLNHDEEEPPFKKRRPSVVDDIDIMSLSQQMDLLRRNSLPILHTIHVPRSTIQPLSVDELLSPSKFIRDDIGLLDEAGGEIISLHGEDGEEAEPQPDSPPQRSPFDFGNFFMPPPPPKNPQYSPQTPIQNQIQPQITQENPTIEPPKKQQQKRRKSAPVETEATPGTPDGRKLVCLGKRPRKNKKTQPEDQYLLKFTMRRNK
jgi:hypothetical protein